MFQIQTFATTFFQSLDSDASGNLSVYEISPFDDRALFILDSDNNSTLSPEEAVPLIYPADSTLYLYTDFLTAGKLCFLADNQALSPQITAFSEKICPDVPVLYYAASKNLDAPLPILKKALAQTLARYPFVFQGLLIAAHSEIKAKNYSRAVELLVDAQTCHRIFAHFSVHVPGGFEDSVHSIYMRINQGDFDAYQEFPDIPETYDLKRLFLSYSLQIQKKYAESFSVIQTLKGPAFDTLLHNDVLFSGAISNFALGNSASAQEYFLKIISQYPNLKDYLTDSVSVETLLPHSIQNKNADNMFLSELPTICCAALSEKKSPELSCELLKKLIAEYIDSYCYFTEALYLQNRSDIYYEKLYNGLRKMLFPLYIKYHYTLNNPAFLNIETEKTWQELEKLNPSLYHIIRLSYKIRNQSLAYEEDLSALRKQNTAFAQNYSKITEYCIAASLQRNNDSLRPADIIALLRNLYDL